MKPQNFSQKVQNFGSRKSKINEDFLGKHKKLKILELTNFSAGVCGVWQRVKQEAELLAKHYDVMVFSSNATKGSPELAEKTSFLGKIKIIRFPYKKLGGESFMKWDFEESSLDFKPDIIIVHGYRHPHTTKALEIAKKINAQCFLVTHAPFIEQNSTRSFPAKLVVWFYDRFIAKRTINKFDKVIAITKWEIPYLIKLGCRKDKIIYIPNGIPEEFFSKARNGKGILFLGRISSIKNLEILIKAAKEINTSLTIVGPAEEVYKNHLLSFIKNENIKNIRFLPAVYQLDKKIKLIDAAEIFVLPSKREAMPQSLIEAMAREKIVISSSTQGGKEIIKNGENGFLFEIGNDKQLAEIIKKIQNLPETSKTRIRKQARLSVEKFKWNTLIKKLESLF